MTVIEILQALKNDTERLLAQLSSGASRLYEISTTGSIVERTLQMSDYYRNMTQQLQRAIDTLGKGRSPGPA